MSRWVPFSLKCRTCITSVVWLYDSCPVNVQIEKYCYSWKTGDIPCILVNINDAVLSASIVYKEQTVTAVVE